MGTAKFPEQITERAEAGRREMLMDQEGNAAIERLKGQPVERVITPEEKNRRRPVSAGAKNGRRTIARKLALAKQLRAVYHKIDTLRSRDPNITADDTKIFDEIAELRQFARRLRSARARKKRRSKPKS